MVSSESNEGLLPVFVPCSEPDERVEDDDVVLRRLENNCLSHDICASADYQWGEGLVVWCERKGKNNKQYRLLYIQLQDYIHLMFLSRRAVK